MREKRTFAERTKKLKSDEAKKTFFLLYEGDRTEVIYFDALRQRDAELNPLIELVPVIRSFSEDGWSNPKKILDRTIVNLEEDKTGRITYESLLNRIMAYLSDEKILTSSKIMAHAIWGILENGCRTLLAKSLEEEVDDIRLACITLVDYLNKKSGIVNIVNDISEIIKSSNITYSEGFDRICLIVDRDRKSFLASSENNQYQYVMETCQDRGFGFYLTNPCFEFWLLLHFDEVIRLDRDMLLQNPKVTSKRRYTEQELRKLLPGYQKGKYRADLLMNRIGKALKNEKMFCEDIKKLEHTLGSNVGLLIQEIWYER